MHLIVLFLTLPRECDRSMAQTQTFPNRQAGFSYFRVLADRPDGCRITPLFAANPKLAARFTASFADLSLDFSKSSIDADALDARPTLTASASDCSPVNRSTRPSTEQLCTWPCVPPFVETIHSGKLKGATG
jgi:hypothetical protein